jgi:hypothetical protein
MSTSHPELYRFRAGEGLENDIANAILDALTDDLPVGQAVIDALTDNAINRYSDKISAMLRRGGIEIDNDTPLDAAKLVEVLTDALGYDLDDLSSEGVVAAVDAEISRRVSEATGVDIQSVLSVSEIESAIQSAIVGGAGGIVSAKLLTRLKNAATWSRAGYDGEARRRVLMAIAQKKYRRTNRMVWD